VLHGVSFGMDLGKFVALIGLSDSGKSTPLNIVGLLERMTAGSYRIQGEETSGRVRCGRPWGWKTPWRSARARSRAAQPPAATTAGHFYRK